MFFVLPDCTVLPLISNEIDICNRLVYLLNLKKLLTAAEPSKALAFSQGNLFLTVSLYVASSKSCLMQFRRSIYVQNGVRCVSESVYFDY